MWSKIIIGAAALFLFGAFLFYKNNEALVGIEFPQAKNLMEKVETLSKDVTRDQYTETYAQMRKKYFEDELAKYTAKNDELTQSLTEAKEKITKAEQEAQAIEETLKTQQKELSESMKSIVTAAGMEDEVDADLNTVLGRIGSIYQANLHQQQENATVKAQCDALVARSQGLNKSIDSQKKLASDRNARLAPADLSARVINTASKWNYVIIDAGSNKDVCIGSRLAVMRGDEKITELNVTTVEGTRAGADIVLDTLAPGESVHVGDRVISIRNGK